MTKRTERGQRRQAENGAGPTLAHLVEPMLMGMATTHHDLLAWVHAHGLAALDELFGAEAVALAGPKGRHQPQRTHHHWGTAGSLEARPSGRPTRGSSKSAVSRAVVWRTRQRLQEYLARRRDGL